MNAYELQLSSSDFHVHPDAVGVIKQISNLKFAGNAKQSRFLYLANDDVIFLQAEVLGSNIHGKFALSRRSALPELEEQGVLKKLDIPPNSGLAEVTHFIYFSKRGVLGVEFNFFGPRTNMLRDYLLEKSKNFSNQFEYIEVNPILNQDIDQTLRNMGEVSILQIEVARNELEVIKELDQDLHSAFDSAAEVSDAESVEIILRKKKYSRGGFSFPFSKSKIKELLSKEGNREKFNKLKAVAESKSSMDETESKTYDLLQDKMITSKKVTTTDKRSRSVESSDMFEKIEEAFNELNEQF